MLRLQVKDGLLAVLVHSMNFNTFLLRKVCEKAFFHVARVSGRFKGPFVYDHSGHFVHSHLEWPK